MGVGPEFWNSDKANFLILAVAAEFTKLLSCQDTVSINYYTFITNTKWNYFEEEVKDLRDPALNRTEEEDDDDILIAWDKRHFCFCCNRILEGGAASNKRDKRLFLLLAVVVLFLLILGCGELLESEVGGSTSVITSSSSFNKSCSDYRRENC